MFTAFRIVLAASLLTLAVLATSPVTALLMSVCGTINAVTVAIDQFGDD